MMRQLPAPSHLRSWPIGETRTVQFVRHRDSGPAGECLSFESHHAAHSRIVVVTQEEIAQP